MLTPERFRHLKLSSEDSEKVAAHSHGRAARAKIPFEGCLAARLLDSSLRYSALHCLRFRSGVCGLQNMIAISRALNMKDIIKVGNIGNEESCIKYKKRGRTAKEKYGKPNTKLDHSLLPRMPCFSSALVCPRRRRPSQG